jgi:hypothetical protein
LTCYNNITYILENTNAGDPDGTEISGAAENPKVGGGSLRRGRQLDAGSTMVQISESGWRDSPEDINSSHGNAGGWMHMMCCMKAYLEYGINLRAGGAR